MLRSRICDRRNYKKCVWIIESVCENGGIKMNNFEEISNEEMFEVDGGVAPLIIYGGAILLGLGAGYAFGYFCG